MKHLTHEELSARLDGAQAPGKATEADRHLAECEICRAALASLAAQDDALGRALAHDPGQAYFESFAARVEDRIRAAGMRGAQAKAWEGGIFSWLRSPRRLGMAGVAAAVIGGAAIVIVTARMERPAPALEPRLSARATAPAAPPAQQRTTPSEIAPPSVAIARQKKEQLAPAPVGIAPQSVVLAKEKAASEEQKAETRANVTGPVAHEAAPGRAMAAPRTDAEAGGARSPAAGFAAPPSVPPAAPKTLAGRKAAPAGERAQTSARDESSLRTFINSTPSAGALQAAQLCGRVVDAQGRPVAGALVALADLGTTVQTDARGAFCVSAPAGVHPMTVLAMGYQQTRLEARTGEAAAPLEVKLRPVPVLEGPVATNPAIDQSDGAGAFSGAPARVRSGVAQARELYARAKSSGAAADYDAAAARWQKLVAGRTGAAGNEARFRLAEARFQAWQAGPTPERAHAATDALIAYLRYAPAGAKRDQAASWLARLLR